MELLNNAKLITTYTQDIHNEGKVETSFYQLSGSIIRVVYRRASTKTTIEFIPVDSWEFRELERMADAA